MDNGFNEKPVEYAAYYRQQIYKAPKPKRQGGDGLAIASMVLGIISLCLFCSCVNIITAIISIALAGTYLASYIAEHKKMAVSGIVMSVISIILFFVSWTSYLVSPVSKDLMKNIDPKSRQEIFEKLEEYQNSDGTMEDFERIFEGSGAESEEE